MMETIKDYLHLYLPVRFIWIEDAVPFKKGDTGILEWNDLQYWDEYKKPLLRPLSSMTEEERFDCISLGTSENDSWIGGAKRTKYLLSKHFDLFGLIEKDLALDATKFEKEKIK